MRIKAYLLAAALTLATSMGVSKANAQDYDDSYQYYDEGYSENDDAEVYYEDYYGANNAYDLYFHGALGGYGNWVLVPGLGWVWRPYTVASWSPYSLGYWGWGQSNWNWISYEPFGHITYHYGNWGYLDSQGWCWFPGYRWAPHTVSWSSYNGYIGWTPTPPRHYGGNAYRNYGNERRYVWASNQDFLSRDLSRRHVRSADLWRGRQAPRNIPVLSSPSRSIAERWAGHAAERVDLQVASRSTRRGTVQVYVPDQRTREQVRREGSVAVRPWLDSSRVKEARRARPWQRDGVDGTQRQRQARPEQGVDSRSQEQRRLRPWERDQRETPVRSEEPRRTTPRDRSGQVRTGQESDQNEPRRATPWRRYRKAEESDKGSDNSDRKSEERRRQPRQEPKEETNTSESKKSDDSERADKRSRQTKDGNRQGGKVEGRPRRGRNG